MSAVNEDRDIAKIYARQALRAGRAAVIVVLSGVVATIVFALALAHGNLAIGLGILAFGAGITATLYALVSHLQARAEAAAIRHLADALDE